MSEKSRFTPGPWRVYRTAYRVKPNLPEQEELRIGTVDDHPQLKAPCPVVTTLHGIDGGTRISIREADAHLIAAAPALYAAVEELLGVVSALEEYAYGSDDSGDRWEVQSARRALSAARGQREERHDG